jgi:hypothetical protein
MYPNLKLQPPPSEAEIEAMTPDELINKLWDKRIRRSVYRMLKAGGVGDRLAHNMPLLPPVREAIIRGLKHWSPVVRRECLQIIDHHGDDSCLPHVAPLLKDREPRVRRLAEHTLLCQRCFDRSGAYGQRLMTEYEP